VGWLTGKTLRLPDERGLGEGHRGAKYKQGVLTENLWPKLFSEAPRCAPLRLFLHKASGMPFASD